MGSVRPSEEPPWPGEMLAVGRRAIGRKQKGQCEQTDGRIVALSFSRSSKRLKFAAVHCDLVGLRRRFVRARGKPGNLFPPPHVRELGGLMSLELHKFLSLSNPRLPHDFRAHLTFLPIILSPDVVVVRVLLLHRLLRVVAGRSRQVRDEERGWMQIVPAR